MNKKTHVITLRVPDELAQKIAEAVKISKRDQADLLREAVDLGIDDLFLIGLNPMDAAKEKLKSLKGQSAPHEIPSILKSVKGEANAKKSNRA